MINRDNRTFICSVVYYDIADYSTKSVGVQIQLKEQLNRITAEAIKNVTVNDRILLDTGDGTAICFLGDPEDALFVAMNLRDAVLNAADQSTDDPLLVRFGVNLGPVKLVNDINNQKIIIGDGVNVGQRVMSFAEPGQILVSRSYYEVVSCLTHEYARLFNYLGTRSDKHIRKHEIYSISRTADQSKAVYSDKSYWLDAAQIQAGNSIAIVETNTPPPDSAPVQEQNSINGILSSSVSFNHPRWWQTKKFTYGGVTVAIALAVILSFVMYRNFGGGEIQSVQTAVSPEAQLESTVESPPEKTLSANSVNPEQTELAQPAPLFSNPIIQQESPGESPPESAQSTKIAVSKLALQPNPAPSVSNATIQFAISPWGDVYVDGKRKGASPPLTSVSITPGKHRIEIRNTAFPPYSHTHDIGPKEKLDISHKF